MDTAKLNTTKRDLRGMRTRLHALRLDAAGDPFLRQAAERRLIDCINAVSSALQAIDHAEIDLWLKAKREQEGPRA